MSVETLLITMAIAGFGSAQYVLMYQAMHDLIRRPRVRGGNKVLWGLAILCVPIGGALIYSWMGPASFMRRPSRTTSLAESLPRSASDRSAPPTLRKVTPIRPVHPATAPTARRRPSSPGVVGQPGPAPRPASEPIRIRRTGS